MEVVMNKNRMNTNSVIFTEKTFGKMINQNSKTSEFLTNIQREISDIEYIMAKYMLSIIKATHCVRRF